MNRNIRFRALAAAWSLFSTALCAPGAYAQGSSAPGVANGHAPMPRVVAVLRFAVAGQPVISGSMLSAHACPTPAAAGAAANETPLKVDPAILDQISAQMQKKLSQKATVLLNPPETAIPAGALTISGCITRADSGNASGRLVGMGVGDSHLNVRVVALVRVKDGWQPTDTFDIAVKGGDLLPPVGLIGLAAHAARERRETLSADAKKVADKVLQQLARDRKAKQQAGGSA